MNLTFIGGFGGIFTTKILFGGFLTAYSSE